MNYKNPDFLKNHIKSIISFYHPSCIDNEFGGYINQFRDDGTIYDRMTKHLVGTCRFIYIYSVSSLVFELVTTTTTSFGFRYGFGSFINNV